MLGGEDQYDLDKVQEYEKLCPLGNNKWKCREEWDVIMESPTARILHWLFFHFIKW